MPILRVRSIGYCRWGTFAPLVLVVFFVSGAVSMQGLWLKIKTPRVVLAAGAFGQK
jgi:hypothetical protein